MKISPLLFATGEAIPLRGLEGVPGLPGPPQDEAGLTRKFETPGLENFEHYFTSV